MPSWNPIQAVSCCASLLSWISIADMLSWNPIQYVSCCASPELNFYCWHALIKSHPGCELLHSSPEQNFHCWHALMKSIQDVSCCVFPYLNFYCWYVIFTPFFSLYFFLWSVFFTLLFWQASFFIGGEGLSSCIHSIQGMTTFLSFLVPFAHVFSII